MHDKPPRVRNTKYDKNYQPHSWSDLDQLGLGRDHYYRRFIELGVCGLCGHDHVHIRWCVVGNKNRGWEYRCCHCGQNWRTPEFTPNSRGTYDKTTEPQIQPESDPGTITEYK